MSIQMMQPSSTNPFMIFMETDVKSFYLSASGYLHYYVDDDKDRITQYRNTISAEIDYYLETDRFRLNRKDFQLYYIVEEDDYVKKHLQLVDKDTDLENKILVATNHIFVNQFLLFDEIPQLKLILAQLQQAENDPNSLHNFLCNSDSEDDDSDDSDNSDDDNSKASDN